MLGKKKKKKKKKKMGHAISAFKCNIIRMTRKNTSKTEVSYTLEGTVLEKFGFH